MRLLSLCASALSVGLVQAYLDTSPLFMWSNRELSITQSQIESASSLSSRISQYLSSCPSSFYILISQPGVHADDYRSSRTTPSLAQHLSDRSQSQPQERLIVSEVRGEIDTASWQHLLRSSCDVQAVDIDPQTGSVPATFNTSPQLLTINLPAPSRDTRAQDLAQNDAFFSSMMDMIPTKDYTVIYTTSPCSEDDLRHQELQENFKMDLKRDLSFHRREENNQTMIDGPLFDKYQFFTPGIFMGFLAGFILLSIFYVGVSALSSLQVTYGAFDKEMGQLAGKKQQG